jgi:probable F420-dependent oxidoreductase
VKIGIPIGMGLSARASMLRTIAQNAERLNFGTLWASEHVVLLDDYVSKYPYTEDRRFRSPSTVDIANPFIALTYTAACTSKIRLATGICLVPEYNPLVLGKLVASLDCLSGGRFLFGIGIGWLAEEFKALGIPYERRADRTREYVCAMLSLWGDDQSSFSGEFVSFENVRSFPKPLHGGKVPVIVGGESTPALRRAAEYGDGWFGNNLNPNQAAEKVAKLHSLLRERGRDPKKFDLILSPSRQPITQDDLRRYRDLGASEIVLRYALPDKESEMGPYLERVAREWVEPAAALD